MKLRRYHPLSADVAQLVERSPHQLAVGTSKPLAFVEPLLEALDLRARFDHVAGPDLDVHREDKQTTIRRVLSALGATCAVMVGDRSFDILGAHACDIAAIGVSWGIGDIHELTAGAERIIDDPGDLPAAIDDLLGDSRSAALRGVLGLEEENRPV